VTTSEYLLLYVFLVLASNISGLVCLFYPHLNALFQQKITMSQGS
jgi:hypothetical protein